MRYLNRFVTCRFCGEGTEADNPKAVKYGTRHYAHISCFLVQPDAHERYLTLARCPREKVDAYREGKHRWIPGVNCTEPSEVPYPDLSQSR